MAAGGYRSSAFENLMPSETLQKSLGWCTMCHSREDPAGAELQRTLTQSLQEFWKSKMLCDFTIIAEGQKFTVHKVLVAAASDVLLAMLTVNMKESREDSVELKAITATGLGEVLNFIYTGQMSLNNENIDEVVAAASHLQVKAAITQCSIYLTKYLTVDNAVDILNMSNMFGLTNVYNSAFELIVEHFFTIYRKSHEKKLDYSDFRKILLSDNLIFGPEERLLLCVNNWIDHNQSERSRHASNLYSCLRLFLIEEPQLNQMFESCKHFRDDETCKSLLLEAQNYHKLEINEKILHQSFKKKVRNEPTVLTFGGAKGSIENFHCYALEETDWIQLKDMEHSFQGASACVVNNFLIVCGGMIESLGVSNKCYVFNPRTFSWSPIPSMINKRGFFPLVHHQGYIYAFGGCCRRLHTVPHFINSDSIERYDIKGNKWETVGALGNCLRKHSACALGDLIYISGGIDEMYMSTAKLKSFNPVNNCWQDCADMSNVRFHHCMVPHSSSIYVADPMNREIEYYTPATDQWTRMRITFNQLPEVAQVVYKNEVLYFINGKNQVGEDQDEKERVCMEVFPVRERTATCIEIAQYPEDLKDLVCCSITIPWDKMYYAKTVSWSND